MEIPVKVHRLPRVLIYVLVAVLCAAGLAAAHGSRIVDNWHVPQWEDSMFFQYNKNEIHSLWDCFVKRGAWWAMIPAVLFASRLALVEVVLHTCEFQGLVYVFFTILSVEFFVRSRLSDSSWLLALSALAFCLDLISKESAVVLPAMLIVYGRLLGGRFVLRPYLVHPMIALSWWILFVLVLRHHQPSGFDYDWSVSNVLRDYAGYFLDFSNWLIAPLGDYIMPAQVAALAGTFDMRLVLGVPIVSEIALLLAPRLLKTRDLRLTAFGFAWFLIATLPFAIFKGRLFMRYSYLGHAGLALCVGALVRGAIGLFRTRQPVALPQVSETIQVA